MTLKNTADRWGAISQLFHWTIAALIVYMGYLGLTMGDLPNGPAKIQTYALHKSVGITILGLVALRLLWRFYAGSPAHVTGTPTWQLRIAGLVHLAIYGLLFAIPISGWVLNSAAGFPLQWFHLVNLPHIVERNHDLHELAEDELILSLPLVARHEGARLESDVFLASDGVLPLSHAVKAHVIVTRVEPES